MATTTVSLSPPPFPIIIKPKSRLSLNTHNSCLRFTSTLTLSAILPSNRTIHFPNPPHEIPQKSTQLWRISATAEDVVPSDANPLENSQEIVSTSDDGVSNIISILLFIAFVGLFILTIGVIYIAVTDFLQKREREKFEKEETAKKKKSGKKRQVRARTGPRGFGQKIDEEDDY
ncbi:hypothetical protein L1049_013900 [Liquidambar formosana]|uniref:Transmembrane protein n=1 Tax=Liquidambar formosana TaxID=63359 RepID=A0AAP0RMH9_LIQFO